jgi:hypothetical protein
MKKKIAVLVSGNIRLFYQNLPFLKNIFTDFDCSIFAAVWRDQKNLEEFKNLYKPIKIIEITIPMTILVHLKQAIEIKCSTLLCVFQSM